MMRGNFYKRLLYNTFLCAGANDYFSIVFQNTSVTAEIVTEYIQDAMEQLYNKGARRCAPMPSCCKMGPKLGLPPP